MYSGAYLRRGMRHRRQSSSSHSVISAPAYSLSRIVEEAFGRTVTCPFGSERRLLFDPAKRGEESPVQLACTFACHGGPDSEACVGSYNRPHPHKIMQYSFHPFEVSCADICLQLIFLSQYTHFPVFIRLGNWDSNCNLTGHTAQAGSSCGWETPVPFRRRIPARFSKHVTGKRHSASRRVPRKKSRQIIGMKWLSFYFFCRGPSWSTLSTFCSSWFVKYGFDR